MDEKLHVIHSRSGKIGTGTETARADIVAMVAALKADKRRHLILHFHGGLVSKADGFKVAHALYKIYSPSDEEGGYPIFFAWESGFWEALRNNLGEVAKEAAFMTLKDRLLRYVARKLDIDLREKSADQLSFDVAAEARITALAASELRRRAGDALAEVDDREIEAELEADPELRSVLAGLPHAPIDLSRNPDKHVPPTRHNWVAQALSQSFMAGRATNHDKGQDGLFWSLVQVAWYIGKVARAVLLRMRDGRDHGLHATSIEELLRAMKVGGTAVNEWGKLLQWNQMKNDTRQAFGDHPECAGTALLTQLAAAMQGPDKLELDRITLVGHSTGAIYIANWLEHSGILGKRKQDVVFLAPAITHAAFARLLKEHGDRIGCFRMFGMQDRHERIDQLWGREHEDLAHKEGQDWRHFLYPASLLYLVSGLLESTTGPGTATADAPDTPLLGVHRYLDDVRTYPPAAFPEVDAVRTWLKLPGHCAVWSITDEGDAPGFQCDTIDHGEFDNDTQVCASLQHIVTKGF